MYQFRYTFEYPNGGWRYFEETFEDREMFREFIRKIRGDRKCIAYEITYSDSGLKKFGMKENGRWVKSIEA